MRTAMVRTDGIVLSMVLLSLCLALCGCGNSNLDPEPTPAPTPAPPTPAPISPEDAWHGYKTAFKANEESTLLAFDTRGCLVAYKLEVVCYQNADGEEECGRMQYSYCERQSTMCSRTNEPEIISEAFDNHPTLPDDYRIATLVWKANWKGSTGVVANSFGVDILVFVREVDPETGGEDWRVSVHVQVIDSKPDAQTPFSVNPACKPGAMERVCEKDLDGAVAQFADNATIRSYDKEIAAANGLFDKSSFVEFFEATELFTTDFPPGQIQGASLSRSEKGMRLDVVAGPRDNTFSEFPRRFVSLVLSDGGREDKFQYQNLARWTWANVVADRTTSHVEHI